MKSIFTSIFTYPTSFRNANFLAPFDADFSASAGTSLYNSLDQTAMAFTQKKHLPPHSSHPDFGHLTLLVFEAVLEVVCVSFPGYILARNGLFNEDMQKFTANLNVLLFTPCLIFTKLGSQLTSDKLADLAVIPIIYVVQVAISYLCSIIVAKAFRFPKRPRNFVIAMGVFGNSNSLPISLVLSLSQTIKGLHWDKIPGDNDDEVAARGILYLLIFQQLGQLLRWSWGMNVLLSKRPEDGEDNEHTNSRLERGQSTRSDSTVNDHEPMIIGSGVLENHDSNMVGDIPSEPSTSKEPNSHLSSSSSRSDQAFKSGDQTPITTRPYISSISSKNSSRRGSFHSGVADRLLVPPANGNLMPSTLTSAPKSSSNAESGPFSNDGGYTQRPGAWICKPVNSIKAKILKLCKRSFKTLPSPLQKGLTKIFAGFRVICQVLWRSMNPPLFAMGVALIIASIPSLQRLFFSDGTFVKNSITSAIRQTGGVAVPLILVVLGANLARGSSLAAKPWDEDERIETKLLIASLIARMVLPTLLMAPLLAIAAKYIPISILDDPIFVIVCFLLAGAPSALQLAQICQLNDVYMGAMTRILFHSYVIWILPSTLILVMCALEVVEWANA